MSDWTLGAWKAQWLDEELDAPTKGVLYGLAELSDGERAFEAPRERLALLAGVGRRTAIDRLQTIEERGWLERSGRSEVTLLGQSASHAPSKCTSCTSEGSKVHEMHIDGGESASHAPSETPPSSSPSASNKSFSDSSKENPSPPSTSPPSDDDSGRDAGEPADEGASEPGAGEHAGDDVSREPVEPSLPEITDLVNRLLTEHGVAYRIDDPRRIAQRLQSRQLDPAQYEAYLRDDLARQMRRIEKGEISQQDAVSYLGQRLDVERWRDRNGTGGTPSSSDDERFEHQLDEDLGDEQALRDLEESP